MGPSFEGLSLLIVYTGVLELVGLVSFDKFGFFVHPRLFTKASRMDRPGPDPVSTLEPWDRGSPTQTAQTESGERVLSFRQAEVLVPQKEGMEAT